MEYILLGMACFIFGFVVCGLLAADNLAEEKEAAYKHGYQDGIESMKHE